MNIFNLLHEIEKVDPEVYERLDSRRAVFKHFAGFGKKLTAAAVPLAMGAMFNKAYGQTGSSAVIDTLKFAFLLENLEAEFYKFVVTAVTGTTPPAGSPTGAALTAAQGALTVIRDHEVQHVNFLRTTLTQLNATGVPTYTASSFDFTAQGNIPANPDYATILAAAQALEDTGVRAYKGQVGNLVSNNTVLQAALQIHSVEARHAAHIRRMRRATVAANKPWITGDDSGNGMPPFTRAVYTGVATTNPTLPATSEANTMQAGANIVGLTGNGVTISTSAATEAFDEPLNTNEVIAIAKLFVPSLR